MPILLPLLALALAQVAQPAPTRPSSADVLKAAPADAWALIPDDEIMVITLANGGEVVVRLAAGFAPAHVSNIRTFARTRWWDGETVYRVQDNYVAQWGDASEKKPIAPGVTKALPPEYSAPPAAHPMVPNRFRDAYAPRTGWSPDGWQIAGDGRSVWLTHCYASVGVARDLAPDVGTGGDLYAVIGHAPRHLDRNIAVVGKVIEGIARLSSLPRGTGGGLGLYEDPAQRVTITRVRMANELPEAGRPRFEYLKPTTPSFAGYIDARANPPPPFFEVPAGSADICNLSVPVRRREG